MRTAERGSTADARERFGTVIRRRTKDMTEPIIVVGHKKPDNDAISAAIGYAYLKNAVAKRDAAEGEKPPTYEPVRLGPLPPETEQILKQAQIPAPRLIDNVYPRVSAVMEDRLVTVSTAETLADAARELNRQGGELAIVVDANGDYVGAVTPLTIAAHAIEAADGAEDAFDVPVAEAFDGSVGTVAPTDLVRDIEEDLEASASRADVVLDGRKPLGIVVHSDLQDVPRRKVILVDHNEVRQAVDGLADAEVVEIVDHHRIGDVSTANPIKFLGLPIGSSSTIVALEFDREGIEIPDSIARILLGALMTDTVILKSPTATPTDERVAERLAGIIGTDPTEYGLSVFRMRGGDADMPIEELVGADSKEFPLGDDTVLIAQHETVDLQTVLGREAEIRAELDRLIAEHGYRFALLMVTDILAEGSQFIAQGDRSVVNKAFGIECTGEGGTWMPGVLSRKKQVAAKVLAL
jgi:manganese-dependent inorganic pyrophosphatase